MMSKSTEKGKATWVKETFLPTESSGETNPPQLSCNTDDSPSNSARAQSRLAIAFHSAQALQLAKEQMLNIPYLAVAMQEGLRTTYSNFVNNSDLKPEEFLPVVQDPTLVRAMRRAILDLDVIPATQAPRTLVEKYSRLEAAFRKLLKERLPAHEE